MTWSIIPYTYLLSVYLLYSFPGGSVVKNPPTNEGDMGSVLGLRRSPGEENSNPLQYSCLGNPEEPGGLQSLGLQRVRHDLVTKPPSPPEKRKEKNQPPFFTVQRAGKALKALKLGSEAAAF